MMGDGVVIVLSDGMIVVLVDGEIMVVYVMKYVYGLISMDGVEILIYIGLDIVNLKGDYFIFNVVQG